MQIKVVLAHSLLCILKDAGRPSKECRVLEMPEPCRVREVLGKLAISPLLVPMALVDKKRVDLDTILNEGETLTLHGPLAGG